MRLLKAFRNIRRLNEIAYAAVLFREWLPLCMAYVGARKWTPGRSVSARDGRGEIVLQTDADIATLWSIFFAGPYPINATDLFIIDAGANIGGFSLFAARTAPKARIFAVEPFPATFERLQRVAAQPWIEGRIECTNCALAGHDGTGDIESEQTVGSQFRRMSMVTGKAGGISVPTASLETFMNSRNLQRLDILKLDIEGSEFEVLLQATDAVLARISRIFLEYHPRPDFGVNALTDRLLAAGFTLTKEMHHGDGYGILHFAQLPGTD